MPKFVIYEVWTKARIIEAENYLDAYVMGEPDSQFAAETGLSLCNWHAVALDGSEEKTGATGALNYTQV